jgi:type I restriction-modification system DNA methylase subunit
MAKHKQTMLPVISISPQRREELHNKLKELYNEVKSRFNELGKFQDVLTLQSNYGSKDLKDHQEPEEFAKQFLIKPLIEFLGYEPVSETVLPTPFGMKNPDYKIKPIKQDTPLFYVEAEPFNTDLKSRGHGISQVNDWLISKASKTLYGIATDGFIWVLCKFEEASSKARPIYTVDLKPIFTRFLLKVVLGATTEAEQIEENFLQLDAQNALKFLEKKLEFLEEEKEEISRSFYNDYVQYVFGYDKKGKRIQGTYLLKEVIPPNNTLDQSNLFAVIFMNRIIFIKFLEENGIVSKTLLKDLWGRYKQSGIPVSFYEAYMKPLFYKVFNTGKENRESKISTNPMFKNIPYLNGGLFREVIKNESQYRISDDGIELVISTFFNKYKFGSNQQINPDMLGYIFEKTINYISGQGTNKQKEEGAYYTPDDIVGFIIEKTLTPVIFEKMLEGLRNAGWRDIDLKDFDSIDTLLSSENRPKSRIAVRKMIESLDSIRVVDPACGSGHFLTAMLSTILRVKENLMRSVGEDVDRYHLKKEIISKNIYGVDIDENGVEIARLRLWLSLIEEVQETKHIETLPNIDFNIIAGNSLIGWLNESLEIHPLIDLLQDQTVQSSLENLASTHPKEVAEVKKLLEKKNLANTIKAYEKLICVYSSESGESAVKIREAIAQIRLKLYEVFNNSYHSFIREKSNLRKNSITEFSELVANLEARTPFHWKVDFGTVFENEGFDVVVGNPPYIEDGKYNDYELEVIECTKAEKKKGKWKYTNEPLLYSSKDCGNTHAYFIERSLKLLKDCGKFGFIVPVALVSTDRMSSIRDYVHSNSSKVSYYNFDDRPAKIFSGLEDCRSTVIIAKRGTGIQTVTTSKYHRWFTKGRTKFLKSLKTVTWKISTPRELVPKIGTSIEKEIMSKMEKKSSQKKIADIRKKKNETKIWYHNAPRYWIHSHTDEYLPKVEYFNKADWNNEKNRNPFRVAESAQYKSLEFEPPIAVIINGLLNSSLFYWWYIAWSDGRHLLAQHVNSFNINPDVFDKSLLDRLTPLLIALMEDYEKNHYSKVNVRMGGYVIRLKEYKPRKSKSIIDQIDDIFAEHFGFTEKEKEFIKTFDLKFRI